MDRRWMWPPDRDNYVSANFNNYNNNESALTATSQEFENIADTIVAHGDFYNFFNLYISSLFIWQILKYLITPIILLYSKISSLIKFHS